MNAIALPTQTTPATLTAQRVLMVLLLAVTGGSVDAVIVLGFGVLTAAQTGNTITLATALAQGHVATALHAITSVAGYMSGAAIGEMVIVQRRDDSAWLSALGWTLVVEIVPLAGLLVAWHWVGTTAVVSISMSLVALAALAMGIQSASVLRLHAGPTTTYVTGTLTSFTTELIRWLHWVETEHPSAPTVPVPRSANWVTGDGPWFYGLTWLVYAGGAVCGGLLFLGIREFALLLPLAALVTVLKLDHNSQ